MTPVRFSFVVRSASTGMQRATDGCQRRGATRNDHFPTFPLGGAGTRASLRRFYRGIRTCGYHGLDHGNRYRRCDEKPLANVGVRAASPSQSQSTATNAHGFFVLQNLSPDTYIVSAESGGDKTVVVDGIPVQQDLNVPLNLTLAGALKTIGRSSTAGGSLLKGTQTTDVYNITGAQLNAASVGDNLHKTLYEHIATSPGVTSNGFPGLPRIRGGSATDTGSPAVTARYARKRVRNGRLVSAVRPQRAVRPVGLHRWNLLRVSLVQAPRRDRRCILRVERDDGCPVGCDPARPLVD